MKTRTTARQAPRSGAIGRVVGRPAVRRARASWRGAGAGAKYGNKRTTVDGLTFASKREAGRYTQLRALAGAGLIAQLSTQPRFALDVVAPNGEVITVATYSADFRYLDGAGRVVIEDAKGFKTTVYRLKKRHVEAQYGIVITEV